MKNQNSLDSVCAALAYAIGIEAPAQAAPANEQMVEYIDTVFGGHKADRLVMYNPDAIAQWIYEKYTHFCTQAEKNSDLKVPLCAVMPSVTPVCFGTMYTGAQPAVHGIQKYEKPIIRIDTLFDAALRAGKKIALVTTGRCSLSKIYLERDMDYYCFETGGIQAVNACVAELILRDEYDIIVIYNGNYDAIMHKFGPESPEALAELRTNCHEFGVLSHLIRNNWKKHNTFVGFAMDHGCHEIDDNCGSHGLDMDEDLNIMHLYKGYAKVEE